MLRTFYQNLTRPIQGQSTTIKMGKINKIGKSFTEIGKYLEFGTNGKEKKHDFSF